jgi:predicted nuclease of predicted toxin-antitoxin system
LALNLYLDDCADSRLLVQLLIQAGHTVVRPVDAGTAGEADQAHFAYAIQHGLILVTKDPDDFEALHQQNPNHPGIFGIYQDNDRTRDMTHADIVAAIARIEAASPLGYPIAGQFHVLNDWR